MLSPRQAATFKYSGVLREKINEENNGQRLLMNEENIQRVPATISPPTGEQNAD